MICKKIGQKIFEYLNLNENIWNFYASACRNENKLITVFEWLFIVKTFRRDVAYSIHSSSEPTKQEFLWIKWSATAKYAKI